MRELTFIQVLSQSNLFYFAISRDDGRVLIKVSVKQDWKLLYVAFRQLYNKFGLKVAY